MCNGGVLQLTSIADLRRVMFKVIITETAAVLEGKNGTAIFSFTEDDRKNHALSPEAKRMALSSVETSIKEGKFAADFEAWLNSLVEKWADLGGK